MTALATDPGRKTPARLASSAILSLQSDDRLVKLAREGHERAFDAIVSRYRSALVRFCGRILPESRTEDAVQQTFINAHAALLASDEPVQLKAWLYTIARNASLNMLRQNGWNYDQIPLDFDGVRRPDQIVEQRIQLQTAVTAVSNLPDRQRDAIVMREFEGRSYEEIALALGANDGAVRQLLNRARGTLRAAASAIMPPPIIARAASSLPPADGRRAAEILGSLGAAGAVKVGATALVAGSLVVGAVGAPPFVSSHHPVRAKASAASTKRAAASAPATAANTTVSFNASGAAATPGNHGSSHRANGHSGTAGGRHGGSGNAHSRSHGDGTFQPTSRERSGSGEHRSSSGEDNHSNSGGTTHEQSHDSPTSGTGDHSGTSGSGESTDSGTSGSGTSGSGSEDLTTTSGTSGSSDGLDSGTSGSTTDSGTSGSDSSTSTSGTSGSTDTTSTSGATDSTTVSLEDH